MKDDESTIEETPAQADESEGWDAKSLKIIRQVADARFGGNCSAAVRYLVELGDEEDKRRTAELAAIRKGRTQMDMGALGQGAGS